MGSKKYGKRLTLKTKNYSSKYNYDQYNTEEHLAQNVKMSSE